MPLTVKHTELPDEEGLAELYQQYRREFIRWAMHNFRCSQDDAKDVYQASIIVVYENKMAGKLNYLNSSIKTYLFGVGKNKIREMKRGQQKTSMLAEDYDPPEKISEVADPELLNLVVNSLTKLGEPCQSLLQEVYYNRMSMDNIAKKLGYKNEDAAKSQKYKCLMRLRKVFKDFQVKTSAV